MTPEDASREIERAAGRLIPTAPIMTPDQLAANVAAAGFTGPVPREVSVSFEPIRRMSAERIAGLFDVPVHMVRRAWSLEVFPPPSAPMLSHNIHDKSPHVRARWVRAWRAHAFDRATAAALPVGLARVRIDAVMRFRDALHRDVDNYRATLKPIIDALCARTRYRSMAPGYGMIADDTPAHLDGPYLTFGPMLPTGREGPLGLVSLLITELEA